MLDALLQDVRYAVRALRSSPGFAVVAILSLALGIGANTAIFSLIDAILLKSLPVSHPEQLQLVQFGDGNNGSFTNPLWEAIRDRQDVYSGITAYGGWRFNLATGGEARYINGNYVSGQYFETLGVHPALGRTFNLSDDQRGCPGTAVLGYSFWQKEYGGRSDVLSKTISIDAHPFEIVGVAAAGFSGAIVGRGMDVFVPICSEKIIRGENNSLDQRSSWWLQIIGRPKPGISLEQSIARLKILAPEIMQATVPKWDAARQAGYLKRTLVAIPAGGGVSYLRKLYRTALMALMVAVGLVLLIACANVANLLLARGAARQREIAIRMALGSGRGRLIRQLLTESLLLSILGASLGILFAQWGSRLLVTFLSSRSNPVFLDLTIDARVLAFTAAIAVLTGLLFGLAPAWRGTRVEPQFAMKANARGVISSDGAGSKFRLGKALVIVQIALSLVLVVGAGLMLSTFWKLATLDPGFDRNHVLLLGVDLRNGNYPKDRRGPTFDEMLEKLRALPGVTSASSSDMTPISGNNWNDVLFFQDYVSKSKHDTLVNFNQVTPRFFETLGMPLLAGRDFNAHDTTSSPKVALVNQALVKKFFGSQNPIGKTYYQKKGDGTPTPPVEIIGIVGDAKYLKLNEETQPTAYVAMSQGEFPSQQRNFELRAAPGYDVTALIPGAKAAVEGINPHVSLEFTTLAIQVNESLTRERLLATLSGFFGGLALLLATIGLYGVMSYNVARRRNEIGIRMALGAEQSRVLRMVLGEVALLVGIGLIIGLGAALATTRFVSSFLFDLKPNDPRTLTLAAVVLALVAALAGYLPARRASRLDPMTALREE